MLLETTKDLLLTKGGMLSVLYIKDSNDQTSFINLAEAGPMDDPEFRIITISALGKEFRSQGIHIVEAVMLFEGWYLSAKAPDAHRTPPSQHPLRQEGLLIMGRNAANSRSTSVVQPFTRDDQNRPVWQELIVAEYNTPVTTSTRPIGLLDYLFEPTSQIL